MFVSKLSASNLRSAALIATMALLAATTAVAQSGDDREAFIEQGQRNLPGSAFTEQRGAADGGQTRSRLQSSGPAKERSTLQNVNQDFWIYDATTRLLFDDDGDGFFTRLELDFDADTVFSQADVYAVIFLSLEGGEWEELTTTQVFSIFGANSDDSYFVDADLLAGYPSGSYDVLIELYDTFDNAFVAEFGPEDSTALFDLPMEDQNIDAVIIGGPVIAIREGGGGAMGLISLLLLLGTTLARGRRR